MTTEPTISPDLTRRYHEAQATVTEYQAAQRAIADHKRDAKAARIRAGRQTLADMRIKHEAAIIDAAKANDAAALASAVAEAVSEVEAFTPELTEIRELVGADAARRWIQECQHEGFTADASTVRVSLALYVGYLGLSEGMRYAQQYVLETTGTPIASAVRRLTREPSLANAELMLWVLSELKRLGVGPTKHYGYNSFGDPQKYNEARYMRGFQFALDKWPLKDQVDLLEYRLINHHPALGF